MHAFPLPGLTVLGGCLCFIVNNKAGSHVWAMKEYGVTKSWVMPFFFKLMRAMFLGYLLFAHL